MTDPAQVLCRLLDLPDPGSLAFTAGGGDWPLRGFVVRSGDHAYAFVNRCPHAGHPLDWPPHRFLSADASLIQCSSHGAQFVIESGECVAGPCVGSRLAAIAVRVENGLVVLEEDADALARRFG